MSDATNEDGPRGNFYTGMGLDRADRLRRDHAAEHLAAFIEEAAEVYDRRGLFKTRYSASIDCFSPSSAWK